MMHVVRSGDGAITVSDAALTQIVLRAAEGVEGARVRRRLRRLPLEIEDETARVDIGIAVAYGRVLPDVAREVQTQVTDALTRMCGLDVAAVDVTVEELDR